MPFTNMEVALIPPIDDVDTPIDANVMARAYTEEFVHTSGAFP